MNNKVIQQGTRKLPPLNVSFTFIIISIMANPSACIINEWKYMFKYL